MVPPIEGIYVVRHGESEEDVDTDVKWEIDDSEIPLTAKGILQAQEMAANIRDELSDFDKITLFVSPYQRTIETADVILKTLNDSRVEAVIEPSIRSLDWGNVTPENIKGVEDERYKVGVLHYEFPGGDKSQEFIGNIYDFVYRVIQEKHIDSKNKECVVIVGHGFSLRVIVKAFTDMNDEDFKWIKNPPNTHVARIYFDTEKNNFFMKEPLESRSPAVKTEG